MPNLEIADGVDELAARIANVTGIDFADAGHLIPAERPDAFAMTLLEFGGTV